MRRSQKELSHPPDSSGMGAGTGKKPPSERGHSSEWLGDALADGGGGEPGIAAKQLVSAVPVENHGDLRARQARDDVGGNGGRIAERAIVVLYQGLEQLGLGGLHAKARMIAVEPSRRFFGVTELVVRGLALESDAEGLHRP